MPRKASVAALYQCCRLSQLNEGSPRPCDVDGKSWYKATMEPATEKHIESRDGVCGGKPCVAGTRIRVWDIYVSHEVRGMTPDEIVAQYPEISLAEVHAAMAYYWDHREAIDKQIKEADEFVDQLRAVTGPGPLERKLRGMDSGSDSVSS